MSDQSTSTVERHGKSPYFMPLMIVSMSLSASCLAIVISLLVIQLSLSSISHKLSSINQTLIERKEVVEPPAGGIDEDTTHRNDGGTP